MNFISISVAKYSKLHIEIFYIVALLTVFVFTKPASL